MKDLEKFRFWCQKVIPLVYDNSLSYYEVLCKIRDYINNIIDNINELIDDFDALKLRVKGCEDDIEDIKEQLEDISQTIISEVRQYLSTPQFIQDLIDALTGNQDFADFIVNEITSNEDFYENLVTNQYFEDYLQQNQSVIADVLASMTDYYASVDVSASDISSQLASAGITQSYVACKSGFTSGNTYRAYVPSVIYGFTGKAQVTETGGIYTVSVDDTQTGWNTYIIDKSNVQNKNVGVKLATNAGDILYYNIKRGSLASDHTSVSTDTEPNSTLDQTHPTAGTIYQPNKVNNANYIVISVQQTVTDTDAIASISHVYSRFTWDALTTQFIVLPLNTSFIVNDDLSQVGTINLYYANNDLAKIIFGLLGAENSNTSVNIANLETVVLDNSDEIENLKNSVSDGKTEVAQAITDKGVPTSATDSFTTMASNILSITTGSPNIIYGTYLNSDTDLINNDIIEYYASESDETIVQALTRIANLLDLEIDDIGNQDYLIHYSNDLNNGVYFPNGSNYGYIYINGVQTNTYTTFVPGYGLKIFRGINCFGFAEGDYGISSYLMIFLTDSNGDKYLMWSGSLYKFDDSTQTNILSSYTQLKTSNIITPVYNSKVMEICIPLVLNQNYVTPIIFDGGFFTPVDNTTYHSALIGNEFNIIFTGEGSSARKFFGFIQSV